MTASDTELWVYGLLTGALGTAFVLWCLVRARAFMVARSIRREIDETYPPAVQLPPADGCRLPCGQVERCIFPIHCEGDDAGVGEVRS